MISLKNIVFDSHKTDLLLYFDLHTSNHIPDIFDLGFQIEDQN